MVTGPGHLRHCLLRMLQAGRDSHYLKGVNSLDSPGVQKGRAPMSVHLVHVIHAFSSCGLCRLRGRLIVRRKRKVERNIVLVKFRGYGTIYGQAINYHLLLERKSRWGNAHGLKEMSFLEGTIV